MHGFAQIHFHVPADLVGERHDVLGFTWKVWVNLLVKLCRLCHALIKLDLESRLFDLLRRVVAVDGRKVLALLGQDAVAVKVAVTAQIAENIEGVINVFERADRLVASMATLAEKFSKN